MKKKNQAGRVLWDVEQRRKLHGTLEFAFDCDIDAVILKNALNKTLAVFPLVNASVVPEDNDVYFVENKRPAVLINRETGVIPGAHALNGHYYYVAYFGNILKVSISHAITDGGGMFAFVKTLVYFYFCELDSVEYEPNGVVTTLRDGAETDFWELDFNDQTAVPKAMFEKNGYVVPAYKNKAEQPNAMAEIAVPSDSFMGLVKQIYANPSIMVFLLFANAVYRVNPDETLPIVSRITVDARKPLGIPNTMLNCSLGAHFSVRKEQLESLPDIALQLKVGLKQQTPPEYLKQMAADLIREKALLPDVKPTVSISYMGSVSFGEYSGHITSFKMYEGEFHKINFLEFNKEFHIFLHFGNNTNEYAKAIKECLFDLGLEIETPICKTLSDETEY